MRPASIVRFERVYLASIVIWLVNLALVGWGMSMEEVDRRFNGSPALAGNPQMFDIIVLAMMGMIGIVVLFWFLLCYFAARRASEVAKWIIVALLAITLIRLPFLVMGLNAVGPLGTALNLIAALLGLYAGWLLFRPDAKAWFRASDKAVGQGE